MIIYDYSLPLSQVVTTYCFWTPVLLYFDPRTINQNVTWTYGLKSGNY